MSPPLLLSHTPLHPKLLALCRRANLFNAHQLLCLPTRELAHILRITLQEAEIVGNEVASWIVQGIRMTNVGEMIKEEQRQSPGEAKGKSRRLDHHDHFGHLCGDQILSTGDAAFDRILGGGIRTGGITDLVGESATGKTQWALQLAIHTALGLGHADLSDDETQSSTSKEAPLYRSGSVALMVSECEMQSHMLVRRLVQMTRAIVKHRRQRFAHSSAHQNISSTSEWLFSTTDERRVLRKAAEIVLSRVHVASIRDLDALDHVIEYTLPGLAARLSESFSEDQEQPPLRLVILDSLPSLFYATHPTTMNAMVARSRALCQIADGLKRVAVGGRSTNEGLFGRDWVNERRTGGTIKKEPVEPSLHEMPPPSIPHPTSQLRSAVVQPPCAILVLNHVSDAFDKDIIGLREALAPSIPMSSENPTQRSSSVAPPPLPFDENDLPLAYAQQAPHFTGLLASFRAATMHMTLSDDTDSDIEDDFRAESTDHRSAPTKFLDLLRPDSTLNLKQAALGHVWNNCVNVRVMLCKTGVRCRIAVEDEDEDESYEEAARGSQEEEAAESSSKARIKLEPGVPPSTASTQSPPPSRPHRKTTKTSKSRLTSLQVHQASLVFAPFVDDASHHRHTTDITYTIQRRGLVPLTRSEVQSSRTGPSSQYSRDGHGQKGYNVSDQKDDAEAEAELWTSLTPVEMQLLEKMEVELTCPPSSGGNDVASQNRRRDGGRGHDEFDAVLEYGEDDVYEEEEMERVLTQVEARHHRTV